MRLLVLSSSWPLWHGDGRGGFVREWCRVLAHRGIDLVVAVPRPLGEKPPIDPADPFQVAWLPRVLPAQSSAFHGSGLESNLARHPAALLGLPSFLTAFAAEAAAMSFMCDGVVAHWLLPMGAVGAAVSRLSGRPLLVVAHSGPPVAARFLPLSLAVRAVTASAVSVACVSKTVEAEVRAVGGPDARLVTIPLGVDLRPATGHSSAKAPIKRVLFVGRLVAMKGVDVLLRALAGQPDTRLTVVGDGPEGPVLRSLASDLGVSATFKGELAHEEARSEMSVADVLVVPSRAGRLGRVEGMPRVITEAWSCGLPVVATSAGGAGDVVREHGGGLLAIPGGTRDLRRAIRAVLDDSDLRQRLSREAMSAAAKLSWEVVGDRWEAWVRRDGPSVAGARRNG